MRIRKNSAKLLLGSASASASASAASSFCSSEPWPSPSAFCAASATASSKIYCELSCSPWDVMTEDELSKFSSSLTLTAPEKQEEDAAAGAAAATPADRGIMGSIIKTIESEEENKPMRMKKMTMMRRKRDNGSDSENAGKCEEKAYCKKNDGKGWQCKRAAHLPHSFCSYHLQQLRSYNSPSAAAPISYSTKEAAAKDSNYYYYYYSGFGPWRGKRRGRGVEADNTVSVREDKEEEEDSKEIAMDHADNNCNNVAGDDDYGYGVDRLDNDDDSYYDGCSGEDKDNGHNKQEGEGRRPLVKKKKKKKARIRSLKSLL